MKLKHYVVFKGRKTGIFFDEWENVEKYVKGFPNNDYQGFKDEISARTAYGIYRGLNARIKGKM